MMIVRKLRLQRGWSQDHLSQLSGLSVRTIQRIERGQKPGLESLKSLAAVFDIQVMELQKEPLMDDKLSVPANNEMAKEQNRKGFYPRLITYLLVIGMLFVINFVTNPSYIWAWWPAMGWGISIVLHGVRYFEILSFFHRRLGNENNETQ